MAVTCVKWHFPWYLQLKQQFLSDLVTTCFLQVNSKNILIGNGSTTNYAQNSFRHIKTFRPTYGPTCTLQAAVTIYQIKAQVIQWGPERGMNTSLKFKPTDPLVTGLSHTPRMVTVFRLDISDISKEDIRAYESGGRGPRYNSRQIQDFCDITVIFMSRTLCLPDVPL